MALIVIGHIVETSKKVTMPQLLTLLERASRLKRSCSIYLRSGLLDPFRIGVVTLDAS